MPKSKLVLTVLLLGFFLIDSSVSAETCQEDVQTYHKHFQCYPEGNRDKWRYLDFYSDDNSIVWSLQGPKQQRGDATIMNDPWNRPMQAHRYGDAIIPDSLFLKESNGGFLSAPDSYRRMVFWTCSMVD